VALVVAAEARLPLSLVKLRLLAQFSDRVFAEADVSNAIEQEKDLVKNILVGP
jgi:hypothetical protein